MPVILIHGSWHGSWCWSPVVEQLAALEVPSVALDLDGHGLRNPAPRAYGTRPFDRAAFEAEPSPVAHVTASSAAADLMDRIRMIGGGRPCLLVAHSMGEPSPPRSRNSIRNSWAAWSTWPRTLR